MLNGLPKQKPKRQKLKDYQQQSSGFRRESQEIGGTLGNDAAHELGIYFVPANAGAEIKFKIGDEA